MLTKKTLFTSLCDVHDDDIIYITLGGKKLKPIVMKVETNLCLESGNEVKVVELVCQTMPNPNRDDPL